MICFDVFSCVPFPLPPSQPYPYPSPLYSHKQSTRGEISLIEDAKEAGFVLRTYVQKLAERASTPLGVILRVAPRTASKSTQVRQVKVLLITAFM